MSVTTEGAGQVVTGRFTDLAGNTSEASVTLNIDKSTPTISAVGAPSPNGADWNRTDVIVSFTCGDSLSRHRPCRRRSRPRPKRRADDCRHRRRPGGKLDGGVRAREDRQDAAIGDDLGASAGRHADHFTSSVERQRERRTLRGVFYLRRCNGIARNPWHRRIAELRAPTLVNGSNTLTLTAIDTAGNTSSSEVTVNFVSNRPPTATIGAGYSGTPGVAIAFSADGSKDPDGDSMTYAWNFGDNSNGSGSSVTHAYAQAGTFTITLTLTDSRGATTVATTRAIIVQPNRAPTATANGPYSGVTGASIAFSGTATDPDGDALTYTWSFGDGTTSTGQNVSHVRDAENSIRPR